MRTVVVVAAGTQPDRGWASELPTNSRVIVADAGLAAARALGLSPDDVVGDFDSCDAGDLVWVESEGALLHRYDPDKDATDLELALALAATYGDRIVILGLAGGRTDHQIGNWAVAADPELGAKVEVWTAGGLVHVVHDRLELSGEPAQTVSLIAWGGPAKGVTTSGLRWSLADFELSPFSSRGVSNEFVESEATVSIDAGVLFVVLPSGV